MELKLFLHAGLPRTATTVLQRDVMPQLEHVHYVGKDPDNVLLRGKIFPVRMAREAAGRASRADSAGLVTTRRLLPTVLAYVRRCNRINKEKEALEIAKLWIATLAAVAEALSDRPLLYSDESLSESVSGITGRTEYGDGIPLDQLHRLGLLRNATLGVVLREPAQFLKASYYKGCEIDAKDGKAPRSFEHFIQAQLRIFDRKPEASRIFLALQRRTAARYRRLCPNTVVSLYEDVVASDDAITTIFAQPLSDRKWPMSSLQRENPSWRNEEVNRFILSAPGVPPGITIQDYAATFPETLEKVGLAKMLEEERLTRSA